MFRATPLRVLVGDVPRVGQRAGRSAGHEAAKSEGCASVIWGAALASQC